MAKDLQREVTKTQLLTIFVFISIFLVLCCAYAKYIFAKDYIFYIEGSCNPETQSCFVRNCDEYCPPNGLDTYSAYHIQAREYLKCTSNDCASICENSVTKNVCEQITCDTGAGDSCSK